MAETMTKKWNRAPLAPERVEEMERYLNEMSHEGWQCCEIVRNELRFVRGEQDEYTYRVQYFYESRDGEKDDYLRTLGETGAALVGEYGEALILRKKTADGAFELYSDLDSKIAALEKRRSHARNMMLGALVLVLLLVAIGLLMMFSASYVRANYETGNSLHFFIRQAGFAHQARQCFAQLGAFQVGRAGTRY